MTLLNSINQQWEKSHLSDALNQKFRNYSQINQFITGATSLNSVTCMIAALVYNEGKPDWLPRKVNLNNISEEHILNCLFISCQLLFIKALQDNELSQCERLIFTLANIWANNFAPKSSSICGLINKICYQLDIITLQNGLKNKSIR